MNKVKCLNDGKNVSRAISVTFPIIILNNEDVQAIKSHLLAFGKFHRFYNFSFSNICIY